MDKILVGCEESQVVTKAFRDLGHEAYSCDLIDTRGNPDWHIKGDVYNILDFKIWDLIILHPPCTALAVSGNSTYGKGMKKNKERYDAIEWTKQLWDKSCYYCPKVALENPVGVLWKYIGKPQYIQPYQFGHTEQKKTGLRLYNLPPLVETNNVYDEMMKLPKKDREKSHYMSPGPNRARNRSVTYQGIAEAMANQWSNLL